MRALAALALLAGLLPSRSVFGAAPPWELSAAVDRIVYLLGADGQATVTVRSDAPAAQAVTIQSRLEYGTTETVTLPAVAVTLPPNETLTRTVPFTAPKDAWGVQFQAELALDGEVRARAYDVFAVGTNHYRLGQQSSHGGPLHPARVREFAGQAWREVRLGDLGETYSGLRGKSKDDFGEGKAYIPYLNIYNNWVIDPEQMDYVLVENGERQSRVKYGDIFFTTSSETPHEVGMSSVLLDDVREAYLNSFCYGFRLKEFTSLLPEYAAHLLRGEDFRHAMHYLAQGATRYNLTKRYLLFPF